LDATVTTAAVARGRGNLVILVNILSQLCQTPPPAAGQPAETRLTVSLPKPLFRVYRLRPTAADLLKLALIRLNGRLPVGGRTLLSVHDSVLLETPEKQVEETRQIAIEAMEAVPGGFPVPLKVCLLPMGSERP